MVTPSNTGLHPLRARVRAFISCPTSLTSSRGEVGFKPRKCSLRTVLAGNVYSDVGDGGDRQIFKGGAGGVLHRIFLLF